MLFGRRLAVFAWSTVEDREFGLGVQVDTWHKNGIAIKLHLIAFLITFEIIKEN